jgi:16S rRNA (adenine1518-N6/adenine1519-N6)-dimethyltransferase
MSTLSNRDKKRRLFGQHFLRDQAICSRIAETAVREASAADCAALLEIGPGKGAITLPLLELLRGQKEIAKFLVAERDRELIAEWEAHRAEAGFPLELAPGDFVTLETSEWLKASPLGVVSNLPYSAATAILTRLAEHGAEIPVMVLMFQAEVARRLRAEPGQRARGSLSVWIQNRYDVSLLVAVPPRAFSPPPQVDSEVVVLRRRPEPRIAVSDEKKWQTLLRLCFAHRRKMLRSGLPGSGPWKEALARSGVEGSLRAEDLSWENWAALYRALPSMVAALGSAVSALSGGLGAGLAAAGFGLAHPRTASAHLAENTGLGSTTAALGGAGVAWGAGPFAVYSNPAALASGSSGESPLRLSWGLVFQTPRFEPISGVVVENQTVSDQTRSGTVDVSYRDTLSQLIGASYRLWKSGAELTVGLNAAIPVDPLAAIDTGESFVPEYFLHRARNHRPSFHLAGGARLAGGWSFGAGLGLSYKMTGNSSIFLNTAEQKPSTLRLSASLKPRVIPYAGFFYQTGDGGLTAGAVARLPASSPAELTVNSSARTFGNLAALDFSFRASSALYYDPLAVELGGSLRTWTGGRALVQLEYQRWRDFEAPALAIQSPETSQCTGGGCGIVISPSRNPEFRLSDTWTPRLGWEQPWGNSTWRAGYFFRPGTVSAARLSGAGNYLDPSRHSVSLGFGHQFRRFLHLAADWRFDAHGQLQLLTGQTITKTAGNESGDLSDSKIGAPGYRTGGRILGASVTLSFLL